MENENTQGNETMNTTETTAQPPMPLEQMSAKMRWYWAHRDDPEQQKRWKEQRKAQYWKNPEQERAKALERYYARKALVAQHQASLAAQAES
jgi:hypothetical protein